MKIDKRWKKLPANEYAALFPAKPKALRKIAYALRKLSVSEAVNGYSRPFTWSERKIAKEAGVSVRTFQRYLPVFESYGVIEVKRWRRRKIGAMPNTYCLFLGSVIPEDWTPGGGTFPLNARERNHNGKAS